MATLIGWRTVCDGVDVECLVAGEHRLFHAHMRPMMSQAEAQAFADACESALPTAEAVSVTCEDGTVLNA